MFSLCICGLVIYDFFVLLLSLCIYCYVTIMMFTFAMFVSLLLFEALLHRLCLDICSFWFIFVSVCVCVFFVLVVVMSGYVYVMFVSLYVVCCYACCLLEALLCRLRAFRGRPADPTVLWWRCYMSFHMTS